MDLFEKMRNSLQCEYISDIQKGDNLNKARQTVASFDLNDCSLNELRDMAHYLYSQNCSDANKAEVIALLKAQGCRRKKQLFKP